MPLLATGREGSAKDSRAAGHRERLRSGGVPRGKWRLSKNKLVHLEESPQGKGEWWRERRRASRAHIAWVYLILYFPSQPQV